MKEMTGFRDLWLVTIKDSTVREFVFAKTAANAKRYLVRKYREEFGWPVTLRHAKARLTRDSDFVDLREDNQ